MDPAVQAAVIEVAAAAVMEIVVDAAAAVAVGTVAAAMGQMMIFLYLLHVRANKCNRRLLSRLGARRGGNTLSIDDLEEDVP